MNYTVFLLVGAFVQPGLGFPGFPNARCGLCTTGPGKQVIAPGWLAGIHNILAAITPNTLIAPQPRFCSIATVDMKDKPDRNSADPDSKHPPSKAPSASDSGARPASRETVSFGAMSPNGAEAGDDKATPHESDGALPEAKKEPTEKSVPSNGSLRRTGRTGSSPEDFTLLWHRAREGDRAALDRLARFITPELMQIARRQMDRERSDHTLTPGDLMHEVFCRLLDKGMITIQDRTHFLAVASMRMRRFLIDYWRKKQTKSRNQGERPLEFDENMHGINGAPQSPQTMLEGALDLDRALNELEELHKGWARVVELRYFGGCTFQEVASILDLSQRTVERYWKSARIWLYNYLKESPDSL